MPAIILDNNIPQISLYYQPISEDSTSNVNRQDWEVSYNLGKNWKQAIREKRKNSSLFKVDIMYTRNFHLKTW